MLKSVIREIVDSRVPWLGNIYREIRDERLLSKPARPTPYGFSLVGAAYMLADDRESEEMAVFLKHLERSTVCVDIGANIGVYSCLAASRSKRLLAIEPSRSNLRTLYKNLTVNNFWEVEVFPLGLGSAPGLQKLYGVSDTSSFVEGWGDATLSSWSVVPVTTLDNLVTDRFRGARLLIKMDVEGFEYNVLLGALKTLRMEPSPVWLVEIFPGRHSKRNGTIVINDKFRETFAVFKDNGYDVFRASPGQEPLSTDDIDILARDLERKTIPSFNFLFMRKIYAAEAQLYNEFDA
jgi:FkbM family methyltransferase